MARMMGVVLGLAGVGLGPACADATGQDAPLVKAEGSALEQDSHWQHLSATWKEAGEIAAGRRGAYPFTDAQKQKLMADLSAVRGDIEAMQQAGLLSDAEAQLLKMDLPPLVEKVNSFRTADMARATCYEAMALPSPNADQNLRNRLPLLEKMVAGGSVKPEVVNRVIANLEADLKSLADPQYLNRYKTDRERQQAIKARAATLKQIEKLKPPAATQPAALEQTPQWQTILQTWKQITPLAQSHASTTAQRQAADKAIDAAATAARELAANSLLADAEAKLLIDEADRLRQEIYRDPPSDSLVKCYAMAFIPPAQVSVERLNKRLPLLKQLAENKQVHPAALRKVLPSIEEDLRVLADDKQLAMLHGEQLAKAKELHQAARQQFRQIKQLIEPQP